MRVAVSTLGCKVNQFESAALVEGFASRGSEIVPFGQEADLYLVNTCAVTAKAAAQSRQMLRRAARTNPRARLIATGCCVQVAAQEILDAVSGNLCLVGNDQKARLVELALDSQDCLEFYIGDVARVRAISQFFLTRPAERTRAYVRIQDGCDAFCSYCVVPYARGRSRSLPPGPVMRQVAALASHGIREMVVTGIHTGMYGADLDEPASLGDLLPLLCTANPRVRFRLSSVEPGEISQELLAWAAVTQNFCPHWHVPLQSGSDTVLARMNRRYTAALFRERVLDIRAVMPEAAIGTDVLVGFPGESDTDFAATVALLEDLPITYVHAFPFSRRPWTLAGAMKDTVPKDEKSRRVGIMRSLGERKRQAFYRTLAGKECSCLVERQDRSTGLWRGLTANYVPVLLEGTGSMQGLRNRFCTVRVSRAEGAAVLGRLLGVD